MSAIAASGVSSAFAGDYAWVSGVRIRALSVVLWRAGLRISEAVSLAESDLDPVRGAILVRRGKGGKRRKVGMDRWAWEQLRPWLEIRTTLPVGMHAQRLQRVSAARGETPGELIAKLLREAGQPAA